MKLRPSEIFDALGLACVLLIASVIYLFVFAPPYMFIQIIKNPFIVVICLSAMFLIVLLLQELRM